MKQITQSQLERLALRDESLVRRWEKWAMADFVRENAEYIAAIESKEIDKTLFGEWPKGWKSEMKAQGKANAKRDLISKFRRENVFELDGALWLQDMELIEQISRKTA